MTRSERQAVAEARYQQILKWKAEGKSTREIAQALGLTRRRIWQIISRGKCFQS